MLLPRLGSLSFPIVALAGLLVPVWISLPGIYSEIFELAVLIGLAPGYYMFLVAYFRIIKAHSPSVRFVRNAMTAGLVIATLGFVLNIIPTIVSRALLVEISSDLVPDWLNAATLVTSAFLIGGGSFIVEERWSFASVEELDYRYWTKTSRKSTIEFIGLAGAIVGLYLGLWFPLEGLFLFATGSAIFVSLTLVKRDRGLRGGLESRGSSEKVELRKLNHEERLAVARDLCTRILHKYGRRVCAVCVWGPSVENPVKPYTSLDLLVIVRDGTRLPEQQYVFQGLLVRIQYWQEIGILHRARQHDEHWVWQSGNLRDRIVMFEKKNWLRKLDRALAEGEKASGTDAISEGAISLVDYLGDLKNYQLAEDTSGIKTTCRHIAYNMVTLVFLLNKRYVKKEWKEVFECPLQPSSFRVRFDLAGGFTPASQEEMIQAAVALCQEGVEMARSGGGVINSPTTLA